MQKDEDYLPKLLEYINLANEIPSGFVFPEYLDVFYSTQERLQSNEKTCPSNEMIKTYQELLKDFPSDLYSYIFDEPKGDWKDIVILERIDLLQSLNHGLGSLAYAVMEERFGEDCEDINEYLRSVEECVPASVSSMPVKISVNAEGFLEVKTNEYFEFITTHKIEARRIRLCLFCGKIFWAKRLDKWTCSKACGNSYRQKAWQRENKQEYNERRRANYAYKKSIKNNGGKNH